MAVNVAPPRRSIRDHRPVPGVIEDEDPGEGAGGIHLFSTVSFGSTDDLPGFDVGEFADRLRFMGLDREFVDEAERRLHEDKRQGMVWLEQRLEEMEPPRKPPTCDCGEALVEANWRGRATVRCSVCGSRWGLEVAEEESESMWAISGPTEEWLAAHPVEEEDLYEFEPEDVLRDGLPPLPTEAIEPGSYFPVASWQAAGHGAVLYAHRQLPDEYDLPGDEFEDETEHLVLGADGEWTSTGSGGGNWVNVFDPPTDLLEKYVVLTTGITGTSTADGESVSFTGGLCSSAVAAVETVDRRGTNRYEVDPARPFFVVGVFGRGRVRVLGRDGRVLTGPKGRELDFELGEW
jgi:hypothetical protein